MVRVASVRHELVGDERNMITGFLKNNRMKLSTGSGDNVGRISAPGLDSTEEWKDGIDDA